MNMKFLGGVCAGMLCLSSCISVNDKLGSDYLASNQQYDLHVAEFPIEDIEMDTPDDLSGFNYYHFTVGAVREDMFGLTTRSSAFTLVPVSDTLDFGKAGTQVFRQFHFSAPKAGTSYVEDSQERIVQNVNVYELSEALDLDKAYPEVHYRPERITKGIPLYNGGDSLSFDFSREFAEKYMTIKDADLDTITSYTKRFPGIYITMDEPVGNGGRINMFSLPVNVSNYTINGAIASLKFSAEYEGKGVRDTTFYFYLGPVDLFDMTNVSTTSTAEYPQIALDVATHESVTRRGEKAGDSFYFEGGRGLKPVIKAKSLREKLREVIGKYGNPEEAIISKASIVLPFDFPDDYEDMVFYPTNLNATCRIRTEKDENDADSKETVRFAGLADANVSAENQGDINRSLCVYSPDITHHAQEMIRLKDDAIGRINNYDIWFFAVAEEEVSSSSSSSSDSEYSDYLRQLAYASYYNNMYNGYGGYGGYGYGGYGGYGYNSYSNYYNYMLMAQMYSNQSSSTTTEKQEMMDPHRFYKVPFHGPENKGDKPVFKVTFAIPRK